MGKVVVWTSCTVFFVSLLQTAIFSHIAVIKVTPDLILLIIVYAAISNGARTGMICGFIAGLLLDFLSAAPLGLSSFIFTLVGFTVGKFHDAYNVDKVVFPCILGFAGFLFKVLSLFALNLVFGKNIHVYTVFHVHFLIELALNTVFSPFVFIFLNMFPSIFKMMEFSAYE